MFSSDRNQMRGFFREAWRKQRAGLPLSPLEAIISDVVAAHPEYLPLLEDADADLGTDYAPEHGGANPFLHMGLHIALREQLDANRPPELRSTYRRLLAKYRDAHAVEHQVIECMANLLARSTQDGTLPDEHAYVECLRNLS